MVKQRQVLGILGACFAIGGGITWFFHQYLSSAFLWGIAGIILLKLNKTRTKVKRK
ncbi:MAG TPA: hypothetical protein VHH33_08885 [Nitrososphaeraceae archaeon]|nr:hypothetical protein [Nitrososphaeraceae archaeon]